MTEYLNISLSSHHSPESTIRLTLVAHASRGHSSSGWQRCVEWLACVMRYLAEGGAHREQWFDEEVRQIHERLARLGPARQKQRAVLEARLQGMVAGRRIILGAP
jgi:hypothetical protein